MFEDHIPQLPKSATSFNGTIVADLYGQLDSNIHFDPDFGFENSRGSTIEGSYYDKNGKKVLDVYYTVLAENYFSKWKLIVPARVKVSAKVSIK